MRTLKVGVGTLLAAALLVTSTAHAGQYHVYSCRTPTGQVAPTDGWTGSIAEPADTALNTCPDHGGLVAGLNGGVAHPADLDLATWAFNTPAGETITAAALWRAGDTLGGTNKAGSYKFWLTGVANTGNNTQFIENCEASGCSTRGSFAEPLAEQNHIVVPDNALHSSYLSLNSSCRSFIPGGDCPAVAGDSNGYSAMVELFAADLVLQESTPPSVSAVEGNLAVAGVVSGSSDVAFDASDSGSGVYAASFAVDGQMVSQKAIGSNGGRCREVGQTTDGLPAFLYVQPCQPSASPDVSFDTTVVGNGPHRVVVSVLDAAGNAATVLDRQVTFANAGGPADRGAGNGSAPSEQATLTAAWRGARGAHLTSDYGKGPLVTGRLTDPAGRGIAGAALDVSVDPTYQGARPHSLSAPRTGTDGRWSMRLPRTSSSCALRLAYRSHVNDTQSVATRTLTLSVRAAVALHVSPRVTSVGRRIAFRGRLLGAPIPRGGKQLVLEARSPGGPWIEFHVVRTDAHGRFRASYRFRYPGPANYRFRALSRYEADFPFLAGASNVVGVRER